jgi:hypothetical protein
VVAGAQIGSAALHQALPQAGEGEKPPAAKEI